MEDQTDAVTFGLEFADSRHNEHASYDLRLHYLAGAVKDARDGAGGDEVVVSACVLVEVLLHLVLLAPLLLLGEHLLVLLEFAPEEKKKKTH